MSKLYFSLLLSFLCFKAFSQTGSTGLQSRIEREVEIAREKANIPGLSLVLIENGRVNISSYGYADCDEKIPVVPNTLFELGSCSKAFTALAVLMLEKEKRLNLDDNIQQYLPWFVAYYENQPVSIKVKHLLFHTSGVPWKTISLILPDTATDALEKTVKRLNMVHLNNKPGANYEYATINYDILALLVETITHEPFEGYMQKLFASLQLPNTSVGYAVDSNRLSKGYKLGFFKAREYVAPTYKGNNAAGYVVSDAEDIATWLQFQLGQSACAFDTLIAKTHQRDESVMPHDLNSYAYGWNVSLKGDGVVWHSGLNPNFSSFIAFCKKKGTGLAILTNSNSETTEALGKNIMKLLNGEETAASFVARSSFDKVFSFVSIVLVAYILGVIFFVALCLYRVKKGQRAFQKLTSKKILYLIGGSAAMAPFLYALYLLPQAMAGVNWSTALVWMPVSFQTAALLCVASFVVTYIAFFFSVLLPEKNTYLQSAPYIIMISILSGLANMFLILLITSTLNGEIEISYVLYYFIFSMLVYLLGRKAVQTKMIKISRGIICDLRIKLIYKVFSTSYEKFERIDRGRIYSTMNDDIGTIGDSANTVVNIATSTVTAIVAFIYMASVALWATVVTTLLIILITSVYFIVSRRTHVLFDDARETRSVYMSLLNGMIDGFKELSLSRMRKVEYKKDVEEITDEYRKKITGAHIKFVNAFLIGESLFIVLLATVTFVAPRVFHGMDVSVILNFVIILLYLVGPVNIILNSIPSLIQLRIAWKRVRLFIDDIPANIKQLEIADNSHSEKHEPVSFKAMNLSYKYEAGSNDSFTVGPVDFEIKQGEAMFIIGGNGSGKTTLAKMLTGLYMPFEGALYVNNIKTNSSEVGELYSAVFNPLYLFKKLYNVDCRNEPKLQVAAELLKHFQLENKVYIDNNEFSTIDLSTGQRKRLALLQCYLEDKPVYLFDEWAADQDPEFRYYFYKELIPIMKKQGKIIIAITHDDHFFDVADQIMKLDRGKVEFIKKPDELQTEVLAKN